MTRLFHRSALFELLARSFRRDADGGSLLADEVETAWRERARDLAGPRSGPAYAQVLGGTGACADGEISYRTAMPSGMILADLAGFYRAFGFFELACAVEKPDHVSVELEFVAFLYAKEAHALLRDDGEAAGIVRDARAKFLHHHLAVWIASFSAALEARDPDGFYARAARAAVRAVAEEGEVCEAEKVGEQPDIPVDCAGCPAAREEDR